MQPEVIERLPQYLRLELDKHRLVGTEDAARICNYSTTQWRALRKARKCPPPIKLSERKLAWRVSDLMAWIDSKAEA